MVNRFVKAFRDITPYDLEKQINAWIKEHQVSVLDIKFYGFGWQHVDAPFEHRYESHSAFVIYQAEKPIE